jgi:hypothetical protein
MSNLATITNNILADSGIDDINVVVTTGSYTNPAWIVSLPWTKITGTPTTLAGYGITDAYTQTQVNNLLVGYVPYTGATSGVDIGTYTLSASNLIANGGFNAGALLLKQSSNAQTIFLGYTAITPVGNNTLNFGFSTGSGVWKNFTLSSFLLTDNINRTYTLPDASGTIALVGGSGVGTVTSVAALTLGTSGTDLSSTVANSTTTPVITLNVPTASAANRGALSAADWTTFNNKQNALTNPVTGTGTTNFLPKFTGASTIGNSQIFDNGSNVGVGTDTPSALFTVSSVGFDDTFFRVEQRRSGYASAINLVGATDAGAIYNRISSQTNGGTTHWQIGGGAVANTMAFYTAGTLRMTLTSSGNLSIGNTNDTYKLDVTGTGRFSGDVTVGLGNALESLLIINGQTYSGLRFQRAGTTKWAIFNNNAGTDFLDIYNYTTNSSSLAISTTGAATFSSSVRAGNNFVAQGTLQGYSGAGIFMSYESYGGRLESYDYSTSSWKNIAIAPNGGNVGIGTTSPSAKLDVETSSGGYAAVIKNTTAGGDYLKMIGDSGNTVFEFGSGGTGGEGFINIYSDAVQKILFDANGASYFNAGNVLIGTTTDAGYKLDVNGTGRFTGNLLVSTTSTSISNTLQFVPTNTNGEIRGQFILQTVADTSVNTNDAYRWKVAAVGGAGNSGNWNSNLNFLRTTRAGVTDETVFTLNGYTGAATFSSSVTATAGIFNLNTTDGGFKIVGVNATPPNLAYLANNYFPKFYTRNHNFGITIFDQDSNNVGIQAADLVNGTSAKALIFNPYGGNVLIGTDSDNSNKLRVNGVGFFDQGIRTGNPYGSTTNNVLIGRFLTETASVDGSIRVQIGTRYYNIAAQDLGEVPS